MSNEVDLDTETDQQLVDRLVHAAEEEDLLYVEVCVRRLLERGVMDAVTRQHSWKGVSALVLVATSPHTKLRQLIFQVLLLRLNTSIHSAFLDVDLQNWSKNIAATWDRTGQHEAADARAVASLSSEEAVAEWIDQAVEAGALPELLDHATLTGCKPLPLPPRSDAQGAVSPPSEGVGLEPPSPVSPVRYRNASEDRSAVSSTETSSADNSSGSPAYVQIAPVDSRHSEQALSSLLPPLSGLSRVEVRDGAALLFFPSVKNGVEAVGKLKGLYFGFATLCASLTIGQPPPPAPRRSSPILPVPIPQSRFLVFISGFSYGVPVGEVRRVSGRARCGAFHCDVIRSKGRGEWTATGVFQVPDRASAKQATWVIDGSYSSLGRRLHAWWEEEKPEADTPATPTNEAQELLTVARSPDEEEGEAPMDFGSSQEEEEEKQPASSPEYQPSPSPPSAPPSPTSPTTPFPPPYSATKPLPTQPSSPPPTLQSPPPRPSSSFSPKNRPISPTSPYPSALTCTKEADNPFAGVLSTHCRPSPSPPTPAPSSHLFIPKTRPPPRSTPSPFLPGQGPAIRRPSAMKRGAGLMSGGGEDGEGGEGGEGEKKKKVRKVSFAE